MSKRELAIAFILIVGVLAPIISLFPSADGLTLFPQDQIVHIVDTHDDRWITETGRHFDSPLVSILDPNYDIVSYLIFREVEINFWEPLTNATLSLYTTSNQSFDDSSVTIYGMKVDELQTISVGASFVLSVPYTTAHVDYNTSLFSGSAWHDIDVTAIVEELIRAYNWDGDGVTGTEPGDAIGFVILGAKGSDPRWFQDYRSYPPKSADLRIRWNHQPPLIDPLDDYEYVEQYRNYSIWFIPGEAYPELVPLEYVFTQGTASPYNVSYETIHVIPGTPITVSISEDYSATTYIQRKLVRTSNETLYCVYHKILSGKHQIYVKKSVDDGQTWTDETRISTYANMQNYDQKKASIAVDSEDKLHVVFPGTNVSSATLQIWYANYNGSWQTPLVISTYAGMSGEYQTEPNIAVDSEDNLHVVFSGEATGYPDSRQIWYTNFSTSWMPPLRISTRTDMDANSQQRPDVAVDSDDGVHAVWHGKADETTTPQIYYSSGNLEWTTPERVSNLAIMNDQTQSYPQIAVNPKDTLHVSWMGKTTVNVTNNQIWHNSNNGSWDEPYRVSGVLIMDDYAQVEPTIAVDSNSAVHILWSGKATGLSDESKIWYANYTVSWSYPYCTQPIGKNQYVRIRWSRWPAITGNGTYFITNLNGTIIDNDCPDLDCAKKKIEDIMGSDPVDPDPIGWPIEGPFIRFRMRLYLLIVGYCCVWGPIWFFCWKRPSGYYICVAFIIMLMGLGLLLQIPNV